MAEQIVLAGLGRFGSILATALTQAGYDVLAVDQRQERVRELAESVGQAIQGDATSLAVWRDLPIKGASIGIVAFSTNVEANILAALLFKKLGFKRVIAKSEGDLHSELLKAVGVDSVVEPAKESALQLVHTLGTHIADYLGVTGDFGVARITAAEDLKRMPVGKLYEQRKVTVLLLRRGDRIVLQPSDNEEIREGDTLVVAGKDGDLRRLPGVGG